MLNNKKSPSLKVARFFYLILGLYPGHNFGYALFRIFPVFYRDCEIKACARPVPRLEPNTSFVPFHNAFDYKQPEAASFCVNFHYLLSAEESLEDAFLFVFRDAQAGV